MLSCWKIEGGGGEEVSDVTEKEDKGRERTSILISCKMSRMVGAAVAIDGSEGEKRGQRRWRAGEDGGGRVERRVECRRIECQFPKSENDGRGRADTHESEVGLVWWWWLEGEKGEEEGRSEKKTEGEKGRSQLTNRSTDIN